MTPTVSESAAQRVSSSELVAPELTLSESLRVLEIARGLRAERAEAEVALARSEIREVMRKRLMDAAAVTGDRISESDVDAAIDQYFSTQHTYKDPPMSLPVFLAHLYIRRTLITVAVGMTAVLFFLWNVLN